MKYLFTIIFLTISLSVGSSTLTREPFPPGAFELSVDQRIELVLLDSGYSSRMINIVIAQARHESGNYTSKLAVRNNNIFGMRHPVKRPTTSLGPLASAEGRKGYASYNSIEDSVRDLILYHRHFRVPESNLADYVTYLKRKRYYECSEQLYKKALESLI